MDFEIFYEKWGKSVGGAERVNFPPFTMDLCELLDINKPNQSTGGAGLEDYVFEAPVKDREYTGNKANKRIDLYKRDCFILEAKQSFMKQAAEQPTLLGINAPQERGKRQSANRALDELMLKARAQAEGYVFRLPTHHSAPPFIILCDVGRCFEIYADFTGTGRSYTQFPDRKGYRIYLEDLRDEKIRKRLKTIWEDPHSLDPTRERAKTTREIAKRLAVVSKSLEEKKYSPEDVAQFLMRCVFTMFAEDVKLLPEDSFTNMLADCVEKPEIFPLMMENLWRDMDTGAKFHSGIKSAIRRFNGGLFKNAKAFPLGREQIGELMLAAKSDWREVEPAIFGTFFEEALDAKLRSQLGAHFTPRPYVDRLVNVVIIEPLRQEWNDVKSLVFDAIGNNDNAEARKIIWGFRKRLTSIRVLDPACGTGNFLYASLELMKRLEAEVLEFQVDLGEHTSLAINEIDPHQFLGMELNPRAAAIAELVVWIGYLQWHYRTHVAHPAEPILRDLHNIVTKDAVLKWDEQPNYKVVDGKETCTNPRRPDWPEAEFIIGNPPFIGGKDVRSELGSEYAVALWAAHKSMNDSADFVMYWWDRAADILTRAKSKLIRFGFVTTNSITQVFQRKTIERYLNAKNPLSIIYAIPDHPWTKASASAAAVRIAMTAAQAGKHEGVLQEVVEESGLDTDEPNIILSSKNGTVNSDMTVGLDITSVKALIASEGLCSRGVSLHGKGFMLKPNAAEMMGLGETPELENYIKPYRNGRDLMGNSRGVMVIDLFGLNDEQVRKKFPKIYQHLIATVKENKDKDGIVVGRDANNRESYKKLWWIFGEPRKDLRPALAGLPRYIATVETTKHRIFQFLDASILPDNMIVCIADESPLSLGILSSFLHRAWATANSASLGMYIGDVRYTKTQCFDPFPFPDPTPAQKIQIGKIAEDLDAHRKKVLAEHSHLTMTGLYNVLEKIKAGLCRDDLDANDKATFDDGLILILKEYHEKLDALVLDAYGLSQNATNEEILAHLVKLNHIRAEEEKMGHVRWLRPEYQKPRFGRKVETASDKDQLDLVVEVDFTLPRFPTNRDEQVLAVKHLIAKRGHLTNAEILAAFQNGGRNKKRIDAILTSLDKFGDIIIEENIIHINRAA